MGTTGPSETIYQTTRNHIPEDNNSYSHGLGALNIKMDVREIGFLE
jgi:hypothetical protein